MTTLTTRKKKISSSKNAKSKVKPSIKDESNITVYFKHSLEVQNESREDDKHLQDAKENLIIPETRKSRHLATGLSRRSLSVPPPRLTTRKNKPPTELNADQRKITDYLSQRRSGRTTEKEIKKKEHEELQRMIIDRTRETGGEDFEVVQITGKGRGVVAKRSFSRGEFMVEYAGDLIELSTAKRRESQYKLSPSYGCYMYYFCHNSKRYCIDATEESGRLGRLVNHSRLNPNCKTTVVDVHGVPRLILVANKMIEPGEEVLYDYGDRRKESLRDHPWLAL